MSSPEHVRVPCEECGAFVKVRTSLLGEWITCPKCSRDFVAKDTSAAPPARPSARQVKRDDRDAYEDDRDHRGARSRGREYERDEENDQRGNGRRDRNRAEEDEDEYDTGPQPETCPKCQSGRYAKVTYTWWGGLVGPALFNLVKCQRCGKQYNRKTGKALGAVHVIVYSLVILAICVGVIFALSLLG